MTGDGTKWREAKKQRRKLGTLGIKREVQSETLNGVYGLHIFTYMETP